MWLFSISFCVQCSWKRQQKIVLRGYLITERTVFAAMFVCHHHHHLSFNREGRWGTTGCFTTSFLHVSQFFTSLWDLANSRPVHSLMLSSHFFFPVCLVFFPLSLCLARWFWPDLMYKRHVHTTAVCVSLRWSGGSSSGPIACWILAQTSSLVVS